MSSRERNEEVNEGKRRERETAAIMTSALHVMTSSRIIRKKRSSRNEILMTTDDVIRIFLMTSDDVIAITCLREGSLCDRNADDILLWTFAGIRLEKPKKGNSQN